jgi:5,10-methylenetetrahydromethanopterin reductase
MRMKFSVGTGRITDISQAAQLARTAEECGYSRISFPDTPAFNRDVHVMMTVAAMNTHLIHIGHGVTDPVTVHPSVIANATATVDELSGGRAYVGLGAGGPYGKSSRSRANHRRWRLTRASCRRACANWRRNWR